MNAGPGTFRVCGSHWIVFRNRCEGGMAKLVNMGNRRAARGSGGEPQRDLRPSRSEAEDAVRTLIRWAGDDPDREGLRGTPGRVVRAYEEWFWGYTEDPTDYLQRTFEEVAGYDEVVVLRDIRFESHCGHHMAPIVGRVHIGYLPRNRVVGISKLARLVDAYARRLQIHERMTAESAKPPDHTLNPHGLARVVEGRRGGAYDWGRDREGSRGRQGAGQSARERLPRGAREARSGEASPRVRTKVTLSPRATGARGFPTIIEFACRSPDTPANPFSREGCMRGFSQADRVLREAAEAAQVPGVVAVAATREGPVYQGAFGKRALPARPPPAPPTIVLVPPTPQPIPATPPTA